MRTVITPEVAGADRARFGGPARPLVVVGLGPVGLDVLRAALQDPRFAVEAAVDPDSGARAVAAANGLGDRVIPDAADLPHGDGVAIVCTSSEVEHLAPLARSLNRRGRHVVTSCERLIAPRLLPADVITELDRFAKSRDRTVVSAGVNPGFVMDVLPAVATLVSREVRSISITRRTDLNQRRKRLQEKLGVGISIEEYERRAADGSIGHVGLRHSLAFVADCLGWRGSSEEAMEPVIGSDGRTLLGVRHVGYAEDSFGRRRIDALLEMYAGVEEGDRVEIVGVPGVVLEAPAGIRGDEATVSALLNCAASIERFPSGLRTLRDLITPTWFAAN